MEKNLHYEVCTLQNSLNSILMFLRIRIISFLIYKIPLVVEGKEKNKWPLNRIEKNSKEDSRREGRARGSFGAKKKDKDSKKNNQLET